MDYSLHFQNIETVLITETHSFPHTLMVVVDIFV